MPNKYLEIHAEIRVHDRRAEKRILTDALAHQAEHRDKAFNHVEDGIHEHVFEHAAVGVKVDLVRLAVYGEDNYEIEYKTEEADDGEGYYWAQ